MKAILGIGQGSNREFYQAELELLNIPDSRLCKRALKIFEALQAKCTSCIRKLFECSKESRQAYDFFSNPKVRSADIITPHYQQSIARINANEDELVLVIQDSCYVNYTSHKAKVDIGRIGKTANTEQYGVIQHTSLCVTINNEPLGILDLQFYDNEEFIGKEDRHKRNIDDKRTSYWMKANQLVRERAANFNHKLVRVSDRESDFFEYLHDLDRHNELYVIRSCHNRYTGMNSRERVDKIHDLLAKSADIGILSFLIYDPITKHPQNTALKVKKLESIYLPAPEKIKDRAKYAAVKTNVVLVYDDERSWTLLTNLPVDNLDDIRKVIDCYRMRWHIEDYHKVLKTGYQIEEVYLHSSSEAVLKLLTMIAITSCRLYWMIFVGRFEGNARASICFEDYEWKAIYVYYKQKIPPSEPSVSEVLLMIAKLGGYKHSKHALPPGIKTMWSAFQIFYPIAKMYLNMSSNT